MAGISSENLGTETLWITKDDRVFQILMQAYYSMLIQIILSGGDKDDLLQEGFLGLLKAVDTYNGKSSFKSYVYLCIRSKMITAIKKSLSGKNRPMCGYVSLYGQSTELSRLFAAGPEEKIIDEENASEFMEKVRSKLSKFEIIVLNYYLDGLTYTEISKKLGKEPKCIDNALQRIKKKISQIYVCD